MRFTQVTNDGKDIYERGVSLRDLFIVSNSSIVTARDKLVVDLDRDALLERLEWFIDPARTDDEVRASLFPTRRQRKYPPGDTRGWKLSDARNKVRADDIPTNIQKLAYRPFDKRYVYYTRSMVDWPRMDVMKHMTAGPNIGLVYRRQMPEGKTANYFFISDSIISDGFIKSDNKGSETLAPLYLYHDDQTRTSNLHADKVKLLLENVSANPSHADVLDYIYGVIHSPVYRSKFKELLKDDFPVIPIAADDQEFKEFRQAGSQLRALHLMTDPTVDDFITSYPVSGPDTVDRFEFDSGKVWINSTQYFGDVPPEVWEFGIGAYKPAQKWLEQRKNRKLDNEDLDQYQRIVKVLRDTVAIMDALAGLSTAWGDE